METIALILMFILATWKLFDLFFPQHTQNGKKLVIATIELKLYKAFYREFFLTNVKSLDEKQIIKFLDNSYYMWVQDKMEKGELSDIIETKD